MKRWRWIFVPMGIFLTVVFALSIYSSEEDFLKKGSESGIAFLSGGIGLTEREILKEMGKEYSLKLMFSNKKGEYLSDVIVKIFDQRGKAILTTGSNGPWLFVDLPTGTYKIEASFRADRKRISQIKIERGKQKVFHLRWDLKEPPESG